MKRKSFWLDDVGQDDIGLDENTASYAFFLQRWLVHVGENDGSVFSIGCYLRRLVNLVFFFFVFLS